LKEIHQDGGGETLMVSFPPLSALARCPPTAPPPADVLLQPGLGLWFSDSNEHQRWYLAQWGASQSSQTSACVRRYSCCSAPSQVPTAIFCWGWEGEYEERSEKFEYSAWEGIKMWRTASELPSWSGGKGKEERTSFHTKDKGEELEEAFRDWKIHVHRGKDKKKEGGYWWMHKNLC